MPVTVQAHTTVAADGWCLGFTLHRPAVSSGVVLLLHAMMADARSLDRPAGAGLASALARRGWTVATADLRGHGASGPLARDGGRWTYDDLVLRDLPALVAAVRARADGPVVLSGHSLGGHVALAALGCGAVTADAAVLWSVNIWDADLEPDPLARAAKAASMGAFLHVSRPAGRFPARRLGIGPVDESGPYVRDLVRFWRQGWHSADGRHDWTAGLGRLDLPVLSVLGAADALMARPAAAAAWARQVRGAEVWVAGLGAHGVHGAPGHMALVTGPEVAAVADEVAGWLDRRTLSRRVA